MWISREVFTDERLARATAEGKVSATQVALAAVQAQLEWLRVRVTQLEKERALLTYKLTGIAIETPVVTEETRSDDMQNFPGFGDVGDEIAAKLGMSWDPSTGAVTYDKSKQQVPLA